MAPGKLKILLLLIFFGAIIPASVIAQSNGSIRGTIYGDTNKDGSCVNSGEPTVPGVPVELLFQQDGTALTFPSGPDGRYGLTAAQLGTWTVTAKPPAGFYVSSANPVVVTISGPQPEANNIDFCLATVATTLPGSGAIIAPPFYIGIGALLILIGVGVELRRRRRNRT